MVSKRRGIWYVAAVPKPVVVVADVQCASRATAAHSILLRRGMRADTAVETEASTVHVSKREVSEDLEAVRGGGKCRVQRRNGWNAVRP